MRVVAVAGRLVFTDATPTRYPVAHGVRLGDEEAIEWDDMRGRVDKLALQRPANDPGPWLVVT